ncbi:hypothetical protein A1O1_01822 [Capronia coronata CBS 617.96]|uniref:Chromatin assembly factor 1 subunit A n=1 Tax=Capronia coronata CBS 617.96 TaxID=1182541 RepID=W9YUT7_9EURO|nr:uncharacterized protein A1O1_01822 [Capronia coronata CBS 617.96]EXJ93430.1 hypothetical protein A1O1_01822 [Capronia coronata CBS 617.96]
MEAAVQPAHQGVPALPTQQLTPTSKKRNYDGEIVDHTLHTITPPEETRSSGIPVTHSRSGSPALSRASTALTDIGSTPAFSPSPSDMATETKKRKLTFAEREAAEAVKREDKDEKERQKAEKEKVKAEAKAKKDEEKRRKDEEKEAARRAREEKQKQKDALKQEKEAEKERRAQEALKKEKAQLRIGAFFGRPAAASTPPASSDDASVGTSRRSSIVSIDMGPSLVDAKPSKTTNPDFSNWILPFFVNEHMELAPFNRFRSHTNPFDDRQLELNQPITPEKINFRFQKRRRMRRIKPVKTIVEEMNALADDVVDLAQQLDDLAGVPYKYFFFREDVRPAYQGTYTRVVSPRSARKIARNPSHRGLPDTNYDYDSEAEWQEPEEGDDDLMDEDEKSEDEDADEDMDDFLDDEGEVLKRQALVGDMEPKSSGLCWDGEDCQPENGFDLTIYRMDVLHDSTTFPIDPYSTTHWSDIGKTSPKKRADKIQPSTAIAAMQTPRPPLVAVDGNSATSVSASASNLLGFVSTQSPGENNFSISKSATNSAAAGKIPKMVPADLLPAFKNAISGSSLTKAGMVEVLKKQFPKCSKDAIKHTLETIAERKGVKEVDKKWVLIE